MASGTSYSVGLLRGAMRNTVPGYGFVRNGKQFWGTVKKGWNKELKTDVQKINAVIFRNNTVITNALQKAVRLYDANEQADEEFAPALEALNGVFDVQNISETFHAQPIDDNTGYPADYPTIAGYIMGPVIKTLRKDNLAAVRTLVEALGKTFYTEDMEGYAVLKENQGVNEDFLVG